MAYTLTAEQLADLQADLGIGATQSTFTDAELNRLFTRAGGNYDRTKVYALRQLLMQAAKFYEYTVGQTTVKRQQTFDNMSKMLRGWESDAGLGGGSLRTGTMTLGLDQPDPSTDDGTYTRDF